MPVSEVGGKAAFDTDDPACAEGLNDLGRRTVALDRLGRARYRVGSPAFARPSSTRSQSDGSL